MIYKKSLKTTVLLIFLMLFSCDPKSKELGHIIYSISFEMSLKDVHGNDLLNNEELGGIDIDRIKIFHELEGIKQEMYKWNLDAPNYYLVHQNESGENQIGIHLNHSINEKEPTTYVQWNEMDTDTLVGKFSYSGNSTILTEMWLNKKLVWESSSGTPPFYEMIKQL